MPIKDGCMPLNGGMIYFNGVPVGRATDIEIGDFTVDTATVKDYMRDNFVMSYTSDSVLTRTIKFNIIVYLKLCGLWDWVKKYCPNKRLVYLMDHGKNTRVRMKNYRRAVHEIGKHIL